MKRLGALALLWVGVAGSVLSTEGWYGPTRAAVKEEAAASASLSGRFFAQARRGFGLVPELSLQDHYVSVPRSQNNSLLAFDRLTTAWKASVDSNSNHDPADSPKFVSGWVVSPPSFVTSSYWDSGVALTELFTVVPEGGRAFGRVSLRFGGASQLHICSGEIYLAKNRVDIGQYRISKACLEAGLKAADISSVHTVEVTLALQHDPADPALSSHGFAWLPRTVTAASVKDYVTLGDGKRNMPSSTKSPQLPPIVITESSICGHTRIGESLRIAGHSTPRWRFVRLMKLPDSAQNNDVEAKNLQAAMRWPSATKEQAEEAAKTAAAQKRASAPPAPESLWTAVKGYFRHLTQTLTQRVLMPLSLSTVSYRHASSAASSNRDIDTFLSEEASKQDPNNYYPEGLRSSWPWPYNSFVVGQAYEQLWKGAAVSSPELTKEGGSFATVVSAEGGFFCFCNVPSGRYAVIPALSLTESEGMGLVVGPMATFVSLGGPTSTRPLATPLIAGASLLEMTVDTPTLTGAVTIPATTTSGTMLLAFTPLYSASTFKETTSPHWIPYRQACRVVAIPVSSSKKEKTLEVRIGGIWRGNYSPSTRFLAAGDPAAASLVKSTSWKAADAEGYDIQGLPASASASSKTRYYYSQPCYTAVDALVVTPDEEEQKRLLGDDDKTPFLPGQHPLKGIEKVSASQVLEWVKRTFTPVVVDVAATSSLTVPPAQHVTGLSFGRFDVSNATAIAEQVEETRKADKEWLASTKAAPSTTAAEKESSIEKMAEQEDDEHAQKLPFAPRPSRPPFPVGSGRGTGSASVLAMNAGATVLVVVISVAAIIKPRKKRDQYGGDGSNPVSPAGPAGNATSPSGNSNGAFTGTISAPANHSSNGALKTGQMSPTSVSSNFSKDSYNSSFFTTAAAAAAAKALVESGAATAASSSSNSGAAAAAPSGPVSRGKRR